MIEKAYELIRDRRIEQISEDTYNVVGLHGTYIVVKGVDGSVSCNCPGFLTKKRCSHSLAVIMLMQPALLMGIKREMERQKRKTKH
ncbi:MAG: hypothetical protein QXT26_08970 [Thermoproteota archaeon]